MKAKSIIEKGKRFEKLINREIEAEGLGRATRTPGSGSGKLKGDSFNNLPFLIEAKNQPSVKMQAILNWIDQAKRQAEMGNYSREKWSLVFRDSRTPESNPEIYAVIDFWEFLKLLKKDSEPKIKKPDQSLRWKLENLKEAIQRVVKELK